MIFIYSIQAILLSAIRNVSRQDHKSTAKSHISIRAKRLVLLPVRAFLCLSDESIIQKDPRVIASVLGTDENLQIGDLRCIGTVNGY